MDRTICPIRNYGNQRCEHEKCAWWNKHTEHCAVLDIARAARGTTAAVTALDHSGKDL